MSSRRPRRFLGVRASVWGWSIGTSALFTAVSWLMERTRRDRLVAQAGNVVHGSDAHVQPEAMHAVQRIEAGLPENEEGPVVPRVDPGEQVAH